MAYWPTSKEAHAHMRMRKRQNLGKSKRSKAENWMAKVLKATGYKWTRQAQSGFRLFDFWNHRLGVAVEVDGPEHNRAKDLARDWLVWEQRRILVVRIKNLDHDAVDSLLATIAQAGSWNSRRKDAGMSPISGGDLPIKRKEDA